MLSFLILFFSSSEEKNLHSSKLHTFLHVISKIVCVHTNQCKHCSTTQACEWRYNAGPELHHTQRRHGEWEVNTLIKKKKENMNQSRRRDLCGRTKRHITLPQPHNLPLLVVWAGLVHVSKGRGGARTPSLQKRSVFGCKHANVLRFVKSGTNLGVDKDEKWWKNLADSPRVLRFRQHVIWRVNKFLQNKKIGTWRHSE